jgi:glucose/arabinose dehydrogenase
MRRPLPTIFVCGIALLLWLAFFSWENLRGIGPAIERPSGDIVKLIGPHGEAGGAPGMPLKLPAGFSISIYAKGLGGPRVMVLDPGGTLLVSIPSRGSVVALPDENGDGTADRVVTVVEGLDRPHGLAFRCNPGCRLYIAEEDEVGVYSYDSMNMKAVIEKKIADLPDGGGHVTRTLLFMPGPEDGSLLISVGSSCNVCREEDWRRAKILVVPAGGGKLRTFASGLRNSVFMAVHPGTKQIWATEMGRDFLGDNLPPDEINIIKKGRNYGWPFCFGRNVHDSDFDPGNRVQCRIPGTYPSHIDIPAHSAPLGLSFFPEKGWPEDFRNDLLVAYHGSWNRSVPTGYKVVRHRFDSGGKYLGAEDFVSGWLTKGGRAFGRPVDIMIRTDGTILISDDKAGVIYLMSRQGPADRDTRL